MVELKTHPFDLSSDEIDSFKTLFYDQKKNKNTKSIKEPSIPIESLFKKLRETIMQSDQQWTQIMKKIEVKQGAVVAGSSSSSTIDNQITFNEFLRLLEQESYFRDIMFEYQLFYKSTKRFRFSREIHLTNRRQGQYGEQGIKGIPQSLQAAHLIDRIVFFETNGIFLLICAFENKDVHAIDYASGDIVYQFIFKDDTIPSQGGPQSQRASIDNGTPGKQKAKAETNQKSAPGGLMSVQLKQVLSSDLKQKATNKRKEFLGNIKVSFQKQLGKSVEKSMAQDISQVVMSQPTSPDRGRLTNFMSQRNKKRSSELTSPEPQQLKTTLKTSSTARGSPRAQTLSKSKQPNTRWFGILGLDPIRDEENKIGSYKTVVSSQPSKGGKVVLKREYTYGLDEKLYTSEMEREKIKNRFTNFMKKVDMDLKVTDSYLAELKSLNKLKQAALPKQKPPPQPTPQQQADDQQNKAENKEVQEQEPEEELNNLELEAAIGQIIKKQSQRKQEEERYQEQLERFNLMDNEETQKLVRTLDRLSVNNFVVGSKVNKLRQLNERGFRQLQAIKQADGDQLNEAISGHLPRPHHTYSSSVSQVTAASDSNSGLGAASSKLSNTSGVRETAWDTFHHRFIESSLYSVGQAAAEKPYGYQIPGNNISQQENSFGNTASKQSSASNTNASTTNTLSTFDNGRRQTIIPTSEQQQQTLNVSSLASPAHGHSSGAGGIKISTDKVTYPICIQLYKPLDLIAFALVNRQLQIFTIRQTVAKLLFEMRASARTEQMAVCMSVETHKVTDRLLICLGFQYDLIQVWEFDQLAGYKHRIIFNMMSPFSQVTNTLYIKEIGLILTTYTGFMEIFDNCDFKSTWSNRSEMSEHKGRGPMSLTLIDYSDELDTIAFAGGQGKLGLIDATSKKKQEPIQAHSDEIVNLAFYDQQLQIITVSLTCQVAIWDAQKLECIQLIRDQKQAVLHNTLSSSFFFKPDGKLILGTTKMNEWKLKVDADVQIEVQKQDIVAEDYIKELVMQLKTQRRVGKVVFDTQVCQIERGPGNSKIKQALIQNQIKALQKKGFVSEERYNFLKGFLRQSISQKVTAYQSVNKNESVLPSPLTKLVNVIIDNQLNSILTIDSDALVRVWSLESGECTGSYPIEIQSNQDELGQDKRKLTCCSVDRDFRHIVVAFEQGVVQVNNLHSGQLVFNENILQLESEVSDMRFFQDNCNFWFIAACWEGRVAFFSESQMARGRTFVKVTQSKGSHVKDVISLDVSDENQLATASIDNVVSFWNTYVATESKSFKMPRSLVQPENNQNIQSIRFLRGDLGIGGYLLIILNTGEVMILDCLKMLLLNGDDLTNLKNAVQGRVTDYAAVDMKKGLLVSVSEGGHGRLTKIAKNTSSEAVFSNGNSGVYRKFILTSYNQDFRVMPSAQLRVDPKSCVIKSKFCKTKDQFLVAQLNGRVSLYCYDDQIVHLIGILNSNTWPTTIQERNALAKEEKKRQMIIRRLSKELSKKASKPLAHQQSIQSSALEDSLEGDGNRSVSPALISIKGSSKNNPVVVTTQTKRINKARITMISKRESLNINDSSPESSPERAAGGGGTEKILGKHRFSQAMPASSNTMIKLELQKIEEK